MSATTLTHPIPVARRGMVPNGMVYGNGLGWVEGGGAGVRKGAGGDGQETGGEENRLLEGNTLTGETETKTETETKSETETKNETETGGDRRRRETTVEFGHILLLIFPLCCIVVSYIVN